METAVSKFPLNIRRTILSCFLIIGAIYVYAQRDPEKAVTFPFNKFGISFGNSKNFNGIRFNDRDKDVHRINGLNVTFLSNDNNDAFYNGISLGLKPQGGTMNGVNLGLFALDCANRANGINFTSVYLYTQEHGNINGISVSGLIMIAGPQVDHSTAKINGIAISGLSIIAQKRISGFAASGILLISNNDFYGIGLTGCILASGNSYNGLAITPGYFSAKVLNGISISGYSDTDKTRGLTIALLNNTRSLHGVQLGLINYAANNPKWLRLLPVINMHFRKDNDM